MNNGQLTVLHGDNLQTVVVEDGVEWSLARQGEPGKLTFTIVKTDDLEIQEGDQISFLWNDEKVFFGFLFSRSTDKDGNYSCVAYDQIRYLKNKDTIMFDEVDTWEFFTKLAETFGLNLGWILTEPCEFTKVEENTSGLDMVGDLCDHALLNYNRMYVMYDNFGELDFKDIESEMSVNYLLDENNAENFDFEISVDDGTYNRVKFIAEDGSYTIRQSDVLINQWGLLQTTQKVKKLKGEGDFWDTFWQLCRPTKKMNVKGAIGDIRVRAGCWIPVYMNVNEELINYPLIVDKVTHRFTSDEYTMDMTLIGGGGFVA